MLITIKNMCSKVTLRYTYVRILACLQGRENLPLFQHTLAVTQGRRLRLVRNLEEK